MTRRRIRPWRATAALAVGAVLITVPVTSQRRPTKDADPHQRAPTDASSHTVRSVGPLFRAGLAEPHGCTAAVVDTSSRDVIVTAAHCLSGSGAGVVFAPAYDDGVAPYGTWVVRQVYLPPAWVTSSDPSADYAFLRVSPSPANPTQRPVQSVVGGNTFGYAPAPGQRVTLIGYVASLDDEPVICSGRAYRTDGYPSLDCPGYAPGTSGGPWLTQYNARTGTGTVTGIIGGLKQGGCSDDTSYSSPFTAGARAVLARAVAAAAADTPPAASPSGC